MGGKNKAANRSKNNARPSSSGRSAELLGTSIPQFVGFSGMKDSGYNLSGFGGLTPNTDDIDALADPNFQLVLKKISKKDPTTKLKGLQELAELVKNCQTDIIKAVLPLWPRFYNVLATDVDNRVREATHLVHHQIVLKAKRNIAPYLKQVMAPWFTSQYDTYPPSASAAVEAFGDAFPTNKFQEAVIFCQDEILFYIKENLLVQTAQTLSNTKNKNVSEEDAKAKYERVLISCLQGYCCYLEKIPSDRIETAAALNKDIISNGKFWKLAKNKAAPVRSAWFKALTVILHKANFLIEGKATQVVTAVFGSLEENEPTVLPYVWEASLLTMSTIKEWWTHTNVDKSFLPKLWKILRQGGQGNAVAIYPSLLPLLSHLPSTVQNDPKFYKTYFENLTFGFKQRTVIASRSESAAVASAFVECLQYIILSKRSNTMLCKSFIKDYLIETIEWCLVEDQAYYKTIFNQITTVSQTWCRNSKTDEFHAGLYKFFIDCVIDVFRETLFNFKKRESHEMATVASKQVEFLQTIRHISKPKKQFKVKFTEEIAGSDKVHDSKTLLLGCEKEYLDSLNSLVFQVCEDYIDYIEEKHSMKLLEHLYSLIIDFDDGNFFIKLKEKKRQKNPNFSLIDIYNNLLYKWLNTKSMCCQQVVNLIFLLFNSMDDKDKKIILNTLSEVSEDYLGWCVSEALSHPYNKDPLVRKWLQTDKVTRFFVSIANKHASDTCSPELAVLFKLALGENEDGELYIQHEAVREVIDNFAVVVQNHSEYSGAVDTSASLLAQISAVIYTENLLLTFGDKLLLLLFELSCNPFDSELITSETVYEVHSAWQDGISTLVKNLNKNEGKILTEKFANVIERMFLESDLEEGRLVLLGNVVVSFLRAVYRSLPLGITEFLNVFLERKFEPLWLSSITHLCKMAEHIKGTLCSPYEAITECSSTINQSEVLKYFIWSYLRLYVITAKLEDRSEEEFDDEEDKEMSSNRQNLILDVLENGEAYLLQALYDLSLGQSYFENFKNTRNYDKILEYHVLTEMKFKSVYTNLDTNFKTNIKQLLKEKCLKDAWFWCKAAFILYSNITQSNLTATFMEFIKKVDEESNLALLHLTQLFSNYIEYENILSNTDTIGKIIILRSLISCEEIDVQIAETFLKVENIRGENVPQFLCNSSHIAWEEFEEIIEIVRLCAELMKHKFSNLSRRHWDFGVLSLVSWANNCLRARSQYEKNEFQALLSAVAKLYLNTDNQVKYMKDHQIKSSYIDEWDDVLLETIHGDLAQLWLYLAEKLEQQTDGLIKYIPLLQEYGIIVESINERFIFKPSEASFPKWTKFLKRSCSLLNNSQPVLQLWGYKMLLVLVPGLVRIDAEAVDTNTPHQKGLIFEQFKEKLLEMQDIVESILMGFKLGEDSCRVESSTDSFVYTFAYLLMWDVLLTLCEQASTELRYQYADWLRNEDLLNNFLNNLFRLMPTEALHGESKSKKLADLFLVKPTINLKDPCDSQRIEDMVCYLYGSALAQLPALVRQWWTTLDTKIGQVVEKITAVYVSPHLCSQELYDVMTHQTKFKNMTIRTVPTVREVIAVYTVDEAQMELVISLPANYPLGGLEVQCNRQIGGTTHKQWLLQLKKCVLHQNGKIWDGLSLWNNNLDKKFDGVEECYICFSVLHPGTYQLPKLSCQTCKKKFHSACLYKWFSTSNKSSCPICRNLF